MRRWIITTLCLVALFGLTILSCRHLEQTYAQPVRDLSKMMAVRGLMAMALSDHYARYGEYPASLDRLPLASLSWGGEGSSSDDVQAWSYDTDGEAFVMTWRNKRGAELFLGGRTNRLFYSKNDMQEEQNGGNATQAEEAIP